MPDCHKGHLSWAWAVYVTLEELLSQTMFCFSQILSPVCFTEVGFRLVVLFMVENINYK